MRPRAPPTPGARPPSGFLATGEAAVATAEARQCAPSSPSARVARLRVTLRRVVEHQHPIRPGGRRGERQLTAPGELALDRRLPGARSYHDTIVLPESLPYPRSPLPGGRHIDHDIGAALVALLAGGGPSSPRPRPARSGCAWSGDPSAQVMHLRPGGLSASFPVAVPAAPPRSGAGHRSSTCRCARRWSEGAREDGPAGLLASPGSRRAALRLIHTASGVSVHRLAVEHRLAGECGRAISA
jgi:hypothetical protein